MRTIELTQGKVALVDDEDGLELQKYNWHVLIERKTVQFYAVRNIRIGPGKQTLQLMHRAILSAPIGMEVDHINDDGLDNRRQNLRLCTKAENQRNRRITVDCASRFKGVTINLSRTSPWKARITRDGRRKYLGCFASEEKAALAYNEAATRIFGEFARLNEV